MLVYEGRKNGGRFTVVLLSGTSTVEVVWDGPSDQLPPSPQWFTGQARKHGGKVRLIARRERSREWAGSRAVRYLYYRENN